MIRTASALAGIAMLMSSCASGEAVLPLEEEFRPALTGDGAQTPTNAEDKRLAERGRVLYQANCASCHGESLAGQPEWKTPDELGHLPPPPMDSTGHTWHHSDGLIKDIILGTRGYESTMPLFEGILTDEEVDAIISFFQSTWGPEEADFQREVTLQDESR